MQQTRYEKAFENELGFEIYVPENFSMMGAIGAAIIAANKVKRQAKQISEALSLPITIYFQEALIVKVPE